MFIFQRPSANKIPHDNPPLSLLVLFKAYHNHPMALDTPSPAIVAIFFTDFPRHAEFQVAVCADVVVAVVADEAVEAGCGGGDGVCADIAVCGKGENFGSFGWGFIAR